MTKSTPSPGGDALRRGHRDSGTEKSQPPLTFVSYVSPAVKRQRKTRCPRRTERSSTVSKVRNACELCREKKTRCSGHQPCVRCQQNGDHCQYMPTASSQKVFTGRESGERMTSPASAATETDHSRAILVSGRPDTGEYQYSPGSSMTTNIDVPDELLQEDLNGHFHGGASEFAFMQLAKQRLSSLPAMSINFADHPLPCLGKFPQVLPPRDTADHLIRTYFNFGLSTSRFVHEPSLIGTVNKIYGGEECGPDALALAYMVFALGSHYSKQKNSFCGYTVSIRFYEMANAALEKTLDVATLATSQTRLLLIHYLLNHSRMHEAWSTFGVVVRHIQALGIHRRSRSVNGNHINHEYRKRLFWCVYIHDRILSSMFGRPLAIHDDDVDQEECALANDEDIEESQCQLTKDDVFCSSAAMIHYARLARVLGQVLRHFYSPSARMHNISQLYSHVSRFERELADWQQSLPPFLDYVNLPPSAVSMTAQRQMCTLKLMLAHANLLLYRPLILHAIGSVEENSKRDQWVKRCHKRAIEAANTVVSECLYLNQRGLFSRLFWLINYMQFASIGTLLMYSYIWPEDNTARKTAGEAMHQFPVGVEGDLVGQRYLETLKELHMITEISRNNTCSNYTYPMTDARTPLANDDSMDEGSWINLFLDSSLVDDLMG